MIDIVIAYKSGTRDIFRQCMLALQSHTPCKLVNIHIVTDKSEEFDAEDILSSSSLSVSLHRYMIDSTSASGARQHSTLVSSFINELPENQLVLTLDSDSLILCDNWLDELIGKMESGFTVAGIGHPRRPPHLFTDFNTIEGRILGFQNWENTHVACQLFSAGFFQEHCQGSLMYGDDPSVTVSAEAKKLGLSIFAWKPVRCALTNDKSIDSEFNRYFCVIFEDKVYHHGGASREKIGKIVELSSLMSDARARVLSEGAEWLLNDECSHRYRFDLEEEVEMAHAAFIRQEVLSHLQHADRIFGRSL